MFGMNRISRMGNMGASRFGGGGILRTIVIAVVALFVLYLVVNWYFKKTKKLVSMSSGTIQHSIPASELPENTQSGNYTYSMWFYINDWNKRYGEEKVILRRGTSDKESIKVTLGQTENNIDVSVLCYGTGGGVGGDSGAADTTTTTDDNSQYHTCSINNIPLQKWVNLTISTYGKTLDIYLNGKLYRTCVLPNVLKIDKDGEIVITPDGGFSGWTTNFLYTPKPTNPQQAYNIYKKGYGGSFFGNLFNKYRIKVELLRDNEVAGGFEM
jgi:hypothetical protein